MKQIKNWLVFFLAIGLVVACNQDDEVSYALQEISAPTNLNAVFDIAQDDSGEVSITPTGEGASVFRVFFGDVEGETAIEAAPGETLTHVYGEGEFTLRIVGVGATGLTSELSRVVTISFAAPTNLELETTISQTNPFEVSVIPTAENATVYDVFFGDVENEEATTIMNGETATHVYAEVGEYTVRVVARGAGAATLEITEVVAIAGASDSIVLPITFDSPTVNYAFGTFNGTSFKVVDNPDVSGANATASKVGAITNSGVQFEGGAFNLGTPVDFSGENKTITMKFWSTTALPVLLKFEGGVNDERQTEVVANHTGSGWEDLSFDFGMDAIKSFIDGNQGVGEPFVPTGQYATMVIFVDGPGTAAGTFYVDDIAQTALMTDPLELPISFDLATVVYDFGTFNGASFEVVDNPDLGGTNSVASKVGAITNSGNQFEGGAFGLDIPVDFSGDNKVIKMNFWSTSSLPVLLKFEGGVNAERQTEVVATHNGTGWEELSFDFGSDAIKSFIDGNQGVGEPFVPTGQYGTLVIFVDGPGTSAGTFYMDDIVQTGPALKLPMTFDQAGVAYEMTTFNGAAFQVVANPDVSGANATASNVAEIANAGVQFEGGFFVLDEPVDFSGMNKTISMKFWSTTVVPVLVKFEAGVNAERQTEVSVNHGGTGWEVLTFDFSTDAIKSYIDGNQGAGEPFVPTGQYGQLTMFIDGPGNTAGTFYIDDIEQQ
ncbi:MAG: hypothetical protein WBB24_05630 [Maribacter sp.]